MVYGREQVLNFYVDLGEFEEDLVLSEEDYSNIRKNVQKNVLQTAIDNPQVTFYLFFPPYSICYWEALVRTKQLKAQLSAEEMAVQILLEAENIKIFSFAENAELAANLDNYTDSLHYGEWVNSDILKWMKEGKYQLTSENYEDYFDKITKIYSEYDYSDLYN